MHNLPFFKEWASNTKPLQCNFVREAESQSFSELLNNTFCKISTKMDTVNASEQLR
jgi:hypothetical protein